VLIVVQVWFAISLLPASPIKPFRELKKTKWAGISAGPFVETAI